MRFGGATLQVTSVEFDCAAGRGLEAEQEQADGHALEPQMQEGPLLLTEVELTCVSARASGHCCDMSA